MVKGIYMGLTLTYKHGRSVQGRDSDRVAQKCQRRTCTISLDCEIQRHSADPDPDPLPRVSFHLCWDRQIPSRRLIDIMQGSAFDKLHVPGKMTFAGRVHRPRPIDATSKDFGSSASAIFGPLSLTDRYENLQSVCW